jgi:hypothetical protein
MNDIVGLVLGDHDRVCRLFEELERGGGSPARLAALWAELSGVLLAHFDAVEEIISLPLIGTAADSSPTMRNLRDQKNDICDAVSEARLHEAGSSQWWLAVRAAHMAADLHISFVETGPLLRFRRQTPERTRQELGRQWDQFMADLSSDRDEEVPPG